MDVSKEIQKEAQALAKKYGYKELFVNESGEFFTSANLAAVSVGNDKEKYAEVQLGSTAQSNQGKVTDAASLILAIDACATTDEVNALLEEEKSGKNRKTVIDACEKKLELLNKAE